jgi:hypothetical protein
LYCSLLTTACAVVFVCTFCFAAAFTIVYWVMPESYIGMIVSAAVFVAMAITLFFTGRQGHRYVVLLYCYVVSIVFTLLTQ